MPSTRRARVRKEKNPHNIFHREKIMERNNAKREIIDNSLEGDTSPCRDGCMFRTWKGEKSAAKFQERSQG